VSLDGHAFKELTIRNDFADAMGVLSHEAGWQHGSCGEVVDIPIRGEALESLRDKAEWWRRYLPVLDDAITLRFEVPVSATNVGGISLYGAAMGAYPCDPTLVFKLAKGAHKPKDAVTAIKSKTDVSKIFIKRAPHGSIWRYAMSDPGEGWETSAFDDSQWKAGMGGFGTKDTPGASVGTKWKTNGPGDIWLRYRFDLPSSRKAGKLCLMLHHDEDVEIFVNGKLLIKEDGYLSDYKQIILDENQRKLFNFRGKNVIAVHCHQTGGGQYVDLGLTTTR
jgi:hypothetical protein